MVTDGGMRLRWVGMLGEDTQGKSVSLLEMQGILEKKEQE